MSDQLDEAFERLERMTINVSSPDRSVSAKYNLVSGIALDFDAKALKGHDEKSLAEQVKQTMSSVNRGYTTGIQTITAQALPDSRIDDSPQARKRRDDYNAAVAELDEEVVSPRGLVKVRVRGSGELTVSYRPGTLSRVDVPPDALASETVTAFNAAIDNFDAGRRAAAIEFLETPQEKRRS